MEKLREFERRSNQDGVHARAERFKRVRIWIQRELLGDPDSCVITAFDERWLNDGFRADMSRSLGAKDPETVDALAEVCDDDGAVSEP